jgi:hypothetical protein
LIETVVRRCGTICLVACAGQILDVRGGFRAASGNNSENEQ